jgi:hypothetical protein
MRVNKRKLLTCHSFTVEDQSEETDEVKHPIFGERQGSHKNISVWHKTTRVRETPQSAKKHRARAVSYS